MSRGQSTQAFNTASNENASDFGNAQSAFGSTEDAETKEGTNMPINDQDTTLSMIVLLLACLALAALAHVVV